MYGHGPLRLLPERVDRPLLAGKGHAIGALLYRGIGFMSADFDLIERAVVLQITVVGTLSHCTFNCLVCIAVHDSSSSLFGLQI